MKRTVFLLIMFFSLQIAFGQEYKIISHEVQLGETVRMLSKKYRVEPSEIYRLNKFAVDGIREGMVLQIPIEQKEAPASETVQQPADENTSVTSTESAQDESGTTTTTTKKVTTTIRKKKIATDEPQMVSEPVANSAPAEISSSAMTHTVAKGETLFSIAKKYNISVDALKQQNEKVLKKGLQPGQVLEILSENPQPAATQNTAVVNETPAENATPQNTLGEEVKHKVAKGETLYSLSKKYNVSVDEIKAQNEQALKKGLQVGQVLTIKASN